VSGPLAPFSDDLTLAFRGPMTVFRVSAYEPSGSNWNRVSDWTIGNLGSNLNWMSNAGEWSICHGNGQSFTTPAGNAAATSPTAFQGKLKNDENVNIMSNVKCQSVPVGTPNDNCPGFERGTAYQGWKGNSCGEKMFAFQVQMPNDNSGTNNNNLPAVWILNGQVVRTNQWGCNCRGVGSNGGCGEFDIVEAIPGRSDQDLTSTFYSFKQSLGANSVFRRPVNSATTYVVVFDGSGPGKIQVMEFPNFPFNAQISHSDVVQWISNSPAREVVTLAYPYSGPACSASIFGNPSQKALADSSSAFNEQPGSSSVSTPIIIGLSVGGIIIFVGLVVLVIVLTRKSSEETV